MIKNIASIIVFTILLLSTFNEAVAASRAAHHAQSSPSSLRKKSPTKQKVVSNHYSYAFALVDKGDAAGVQAAINKGNNPVLNKVLRGYLYAMPGGGASFSEITQFLREEPYWPNQRDLLRMAEQKIPSGMTAGDVLSWYGDRQPITHVGFDRYIDALSLVGRAREVPHLIAERFVVADFNANDRAAFISRYGQHLTSSAYAARVDRLLWGDDRAEAMAMLPLLDGADRGVAEARLAIRQRSSEAPIWLARVPASAQGDPGLVYDVIHYNVVNKYDRQAAELMLRAPADAVHAEKWWTDRHVVVRRAIEVGDYNLAYRLASQHGQTDAKVVVQAENLAGWLALRALNKPETAASHFMEGYQAANTPVSRARGAYWLGRCYESLGDNLRAESSYQEAAGYPSVFYGQLAMLRLNAKATMKIDQEPALPATVKNAFMRQDSIRAIAELYKAKEIRRAEIFLKAATKAAKERFEYVLLVEVAQNLHRPHWGIEVAKAAQAKNINLGFAGFPSLSVVNDSEGVERALLHGLIRQESLFNPEAESPVGARGLMQLMPATAKEVARREGVRYSPDQLFVPAYNVKLGTRFVGGLLDQFGGSYILTLAAYNAGPGRVRTWMNEFGDPRDPRIDPIDWIERIPVYETRNYVQRILENTEIYRAKLAGGVTALRLNDDLKR